MCCLFGLLDYNGVFSSREKSAIISVLSTECEARGIDATGIAYNVDGQLCIYKKPLPAHRLYYAIPNSTRYIMGHTRMTTQGSQKYNYNNHPFLGSVHSNKFALAHNGILYNDRKLRRNEVLPQTKIQTDSFVAVQLIEQQKTLNFGSLKQMAEKVEGSFVFTVIDNQNNLYIVKGSNPFCLCHFPKFGFYLYASTDEILEKTILKLGIQDWQKENVLISYGDILRIDRYGKTKHGSFDTLGFHDRWEYRRYATNRSKPNSCQDTIDSSYLQNLKSVASYYGYSDHDIDLLAEDGFSCEEIESMLYISYYEPNPNERIYD